jgi:hypothetical protein
VRAAADAALYSTEFFETHTGDVVAYIPIGHEPRVFGRVEILEIPAADLVVTTYRGPFSDIDKAYASLGTFVAERVLGTAGPIREHYLVTAVDTDDPARWTTAVCWPIDRSPEADVDARHAVRGVADPDSQCDLQTHCIRRLLRNTHVSDSDRMSLRRVCVLWNSINAHHVPC